ncbi:MAG TPA: acyltransferase [Sphingobium sp.]|uniref:acyltransferase n=1 Tax=Sphingobium sp. TaxID=1912891 RepID=UPI002ED3B1A6
MRRVEWIDVAKGLAIILIVMHHARDYALSLIPPSLDHPIRWVTIDPLFYYIRLPLFFLLSGMLASGTLSSGDGTPHYNVGRVLRLTGVYLLWSVPLLLLIPDWPYDSWHAPVPGAFVNLLRGGTVLWYLWATAMAFGLGWASRRLPPLSAVMFATITGVALHMWGGVLGGSFGALGRCLPYYILGIRYPFALLWLARRRGLAGLLLLACGYGIAMSVFPRSSGLDAVREILGICLAVVGIGWATERWPRAASRFSWLGRRTLPIYIFHFPILTFLGSAAVRHGRLLTHWPPTIWLFLPLLSAVGLTLSLGLFAVLRWLGLGWMLAMPRRRDDSSPKALALS